LLRDGLAGKGDEFTDFTLWCLAKGVETKGNLAHFPGQFGVDLTVTMLDPATPEFATGQYGHQFLYEGPIGKFFRKVNGPNAKFAEGPRRVRVRRTDRQGSAAVRPPGGGTGTGPVDSPWGGGVRVGATASGDRHTVI